MVAGAATIQDIPHPWAEVPRVLARSRRLLEVLPEDCGLLAADAYGAVVLRPAPERPLNGARRRALLLRFAAAAAQRLQRLTDPR